ncbi:MAG: hypothetical protein AB1690_05880 [Candidatus Zixiibacteriota bacterium]
MKRLILFAATMLLLGAAQSLMNCADPLESPQGRILNPPVPGDTVYVVDTVVIIDTIGTVDTVTIIDTISTIDTVMIIDTVGTTDTVLIIDTVIVIDTVTVEVPTLDSQFVCARLSCNQKEIVWLLRNQAGLYRLEFAGEVESDQPVQTVKIDIDGEEYLWNPAAEAEFIKELTLARNATIRITPKKPPAFGHAIDICLKIVALD